MKPPAFLPLVAILAVGGPAGAFEHQHHLGVDGGLTLLSINDKSTTDVGAGVGLHYAYGLTDAFNFVAEGESSLVALDQKQDNRSSPHTRPSTVSSAGAGVVYVLDVLQWVPYGGVIAEGYLLDGGTLTGGKLEVGGALAAGLDYQINRSWAVGIAYRQHFMLPDLAVYPVSTNVFARFEYVWGW